MIQTHNKGTKRKALSFFDPKILSINEQNVDSQQQKSHLTELDAFPSFGVLDLWLGRQPLLRSPLCRIRPHEPLKRLDNGLPHSSTCHWILPAKGVRIRPAVMSHHTHVNPLQGCQRRNHCCFDVLANGICHKSCLAVLLIQSGQGKQCSEQSTCICLNANGSSMLPRDRQIWLNMIMRIFKYIFFNSHQATPICTQEHVSYHHHTSAEHILK